jgi:sugar phosphate isomerase/epimerase
VRNVLGSAFAGLCSARAGLAGDRSSGRISKLGLQLYTVRKELEKDFEGTLGKVAAIGYKEVEFAGYFNRAPGQVKAILNRNGLSAPSAHVTLKTIKEDFGSAIETAKAIGHHYLILAYLLAEERTSLDDYKRLADTLNRAGEECKKVGLQFGYHNHDFEFQAMRGEVPYELLLKETDATLVKMELDLYWIAKAGQQPEKYFGQYPGRFELFHVKDMDNTPRHFFTEAGRGVIDFKRIFARSEQAGVKHYFVEQDETPGSPYDSIRVSFDYLRRLRF